ncbi:hypothetical protein QR680_002313 [Steinernema hermaphroditum]|uniref:Serine/threonine specific protein phosphatases domain-containing protein n=1 Tax=Steinernema hermaphroditum TaxID=289476 RepID=A0AA39H4Y7_9BILA|nr:hypothetical protein QR680_002313 [Steinernema hermaphroditum]
MIIRAHECVEDGFYFFFSRKMLSIFSASYYKPVNVFRCNTQPNRGAVVQVTEDLVISIKTMVPFLWNSNSKFRNEVESLPLGCSSKPLCLTVFQPKGKEQRVSVYCKSVCRKRCRRQSF